MNHNKIIQSLNLKLDDLEQNINGIEFIQKTLLLPEMNELKHSLNELKEENKIIKQQLKEYLNKNNEEDLSKYFKGVYGE